MNKDLTRRAFLGKTSIYGSALSLSMLGSLPRATEAAAKSELPEVLTQAEWCAIEAMTGRIIPTDDTPGAIDANCVNFIDKALAHEEKSALGFVQQSLGALDQHCRVVWKNGFCSLSPEKQDAVLTSLENNQVENWRPDAGPPAQFFGFIRALTIMGFLADPKYGGNRNYSGWQVAGYPGPRHHRGGYSDAQMMGEEIIKPVWDA